MNDTEIERALGTTEPRVNTDEALARFQSRVQAEGIAPVVPVARRRISSRWLQGLAAAAGACAPPLGVVMRTLWSTLIDDRNILQTAYSLDGVSTNQVESFFARLRRMIDGQQHFVSPRYLYQYAAHAAFLEDHRRLDNGALCHRALGLALIHPVSRQWKGYWQRQSR